MAKVGLWGIFLLVGLVGGAVLSVPFQHARAQNPPPPARGSAPVAALIAVTPPDAAGYINVTGAPGAVWASAFVGVRNLYTYETAYVQAGAVGAFAARLRGTANTPLAVVPVQSIPPPEARSYPGSLPGGPGTLVTVPYDPDFVATPGMPVAVDGRPDEWADLPLTQLLVNDTLTVRGVHGAQSAYLAIDLPAELPPVGEVVVTLRTDGVAYMLRWQSAAPDTVQFFAPQAGLTTSFNRTPRTLIAPAVIGTAAAGSRTFEARIPTYTETFAPSSPDIVIESVTFFSTEGGQLADYPLERLIPNRDQADGVFIPGGLAGRDHTSFMLGGVLSAGESYWTADGRIDTLTPQPGDRVRIELDVMLRGELDTRFEAGGRLFLVPIAQAGTDGVVRAVPDTYTNNGWTNALLMPGIGVDNVANGIALGAVAAPPAQIWRGENDQNETITRFPLAFDAVLPADLPAGVYGFRFEGEVGSAADPVRWDRWPGFTVFGGLTTFGVPADPVVRLPVLVTVGTVEAARLPFALFFDDPAEGSRGVLPAQDADHFALSTRTRFTTAIPALPRTRADGSPRPYPLEPYLPNLLTNLYDTAAAPLIPFDHTSGSWTVTVTRPDGGVDDLGTFPLAQVTFSTAEGDERELFGAASPVDTGRLSAVIDSLTAYTFAQYGTYTVEATGTIRDVWGTLYEGGGTYTVRMIEPLALHTALPAGVPLRVGDGIPLMARVFPAVPAIVTLTLTQYPLDAAPPVVTEVQMQTNARGIALPPVDALFTRASVPGLYTLEATAHYRDPDGGVWGASSRAVGVIEQVCSSIEASPGCLTVHGRRGVADAPMVTPRPAWYDVERYADVIGLRPPLTPYTPYHAGDVVWLGAGAADALQPLLTVADRTGMYGEPFALDTAQGSIPLLIGRGGYALHSWVRPGATVRQFISGGDDPRLPTAATTDDPLAGQIGAGLNGAREGDYMLLYGGVLTAPPIDALSDAPDTEPLIAGYAALAVHQGIQPARGTRVSPPGRGTDGGMDGGPLLTLDDRPVDAFFWPTGVQPGDVLTLGDPLVLAGQAVPALATRLTFTLTAPDGAQRTIQAATNPYGWYGGADDPPILDQVGMWTIRVQTQMAGFTSAGIVHPPEAVPVGGLPGGDGETLRFFVTTDTPDLLPWAAAQADAAIPPLLAYNFNFSVPDWTDVQVYRVLTVPGMILEDGTLRVTGRSVTYQYAPSVLNARFPMLEDEQTGRGAAASDVRSLTLAVTGIDANGRRQLAYRTFTLLYDRLVSREGLP